MKPPAPTRAAGKTAPNAKDPFDHIVVLMMENRSFDHFLGPLTAVRPDINGVDPKHPNTNSDGTRSVPQAPGALWTTWPDPGHDLPDVLQQIANANAGFVANYAHNYPSTTPAQRDEIMKYFTLNSLFATHALGQHYTVCDAWFSSVPGPTWPNRFFVHSGTGIGRVRMPASWHDFKDIHIYDQTTLYDQLNAKGISWRIYAGDIPQSLVLTHQWRPQNAQRYSRLDNLRHDVEYEKTFPQYVFIEPHYMGNADDDHPNHHVGRGETLIANVYNTLRSNDDLWQKTLFILLFDEHGGFYDHEPPPTTVAPDAHLDEYTFDRLGPRVPAILVSDLLDPTPIHKPFDHTSLIAYVTNKWHLNTLGKRATVANNFADCWQLSTRRTNTLASIAVPASLPTDGLVPMTTTAELNENQRALIAFADFLEPMLAHPAAVKLERFTISASGPQAATAVAIQRVNAFLEQQAAKDGLAT